MSDGMLEVARKKVDRAGLNETTESRTGNMFDLPYADSSFDAALSAYSMCPLDDPAKGALELCRVVRPGGRIGVAHSTDPRTPLTKWLADKVENAVWLLPYISLGCRPVSVLPTFEKMGCRTLFKKNIGIPLWPFLVFVVEKPHV